MITCPSCGATVPDLDRCAACDYPIILRRSEQAPPARTAPPGQPPPGAAPPSMGPGPYTGGYGEPGLGAGGGFGAGGPDLYGTNPFSQPRSEGTVVCPNQTCRTPNPSQRTLCERCGWYLRPQPGPEPEPAGTAPVPPVQPPRRSRRTPAVLAGVVAVLVSSLSFAAYGLLHKGGGDKPPPPKSAPSSQAGDESQTPETYVVKAADVTAASSSVQKPAGSVTYDPANLLDGDPRTAWNSNGDKVGDGEGVTLTFTFAEPVDLKGIALLNGYQKKVKEGGKSKDLFKANGRVAGFTVTTDEGEAVWQVGDAREPQKLEKDLGKTSTVTLTVTDVYPGGEYEDLALSEVSFLAER